MDLLREFSVGGVVLGEMGPAGDRHGTRGIDDDLVKLILMAEEGNAKAQTSDATEAVDGKIHNGWYWV